MNKSTIIILTFTLLLATSSWAQKEEKIKRELTLEKEYSPMVRDAEKIHLTPPVEPPVLFSQKAVYNNWVSNSLYNYPLSQLSYAVQDSIIPYAPKRGFAQLSYGLYQQTNILLNYRLIETAKDQLYLLANHNSASGNMKDSLTNKRRVWYYDTNIASTYRHNFSNTQLNIGAKYDYDTFNAIYLPYPISENKKYDSHNQTIQQLQINTALKTITAEKFIWNIALNYQGFYAKNTNPIENSYLGEHHLTTKLNLSTTINERAIVGLDLKMDNLFYCASTPNNNFTIVSLNPYISGGKTLSWRVGLTADISMNDGTVFRFAPDLSVEYRPFNHGSLFAKLCGGKEILTTSQLYNQVRYIAYEHQSYYTPFDFSLGGSTNIIPNTTIHLFAGAKWATNKPFLQSPNGLLNLQKTTGTFNANAGVKFAYNRNNSLLINLVAQFDKWYTTDNKYIPYFSYIPVFTLNADAGYHWRKWSTSIAYSLLAGRTLDQTKMMLSPLHFFDAKVSYNLTPTITVGLSLNNQQFKEYILLQENPTQKFSALLTGSIRF